MKRAKGKITLHDAVSRAGIAKALPKQDQLLREGSDAGAGIWASAVALLSPVKLKFALNAATNTCRTTRTLPCGEAWMQVVGYVGSVNLSVMSLTIVALRLRRYNHQHDTILLIMCLKLTIFVQHYS